MNVFEMVVLIVFLGVIGKVLSSRQKYRRPDPDKFKSELDDAGVTGQLSKIDELEERIRVLERIVTDKKHTLAEEIDRL